MLRSFWLSVFLVLSFFDSFAFAAKCYYPDGSPVLESDFQPCVLTSGVSSMCCATNRVGIVDVCLTNGLCHNPCKDGTHCSNIPGQYWRESCTDPSWKSPFCLKGVCTNNAENGSSDGTVRLSQCAIDGHWCCGNMNSEACCAMDSRFFLAATIGASSSTSSTSSRPESSSVNQGSKVQPTSSLDSASISSSISTPTSTPPASHSQAGKSAGLGVGIGVGVLAIGAIVFWFVVRRQRRRAHRNQYQHPVKQVHDMAYGLNVIHPAELENESRLAKPEIDGASTHEMDGAGTHKMYGASPHGRHDNGILRNTHVARNT